VLRSGLAVIGAGSCVITDSNFSTHVSSDPQTVGIKRVSIGGESTILRRTSATSGEGIQDLTVVHVHLSLMFII
jgi:hypothetical protein